MARATFSDRVTCEELVPGAHIRAVLCTVGEELQKSRKAARDAVLPPPEARRSSAVELGCLLAGTFFLD